MMEPLTPCLPAKRIPAVVGERGMTLIEMIVVLAIIGISASAAVLSLGAGQNGNDQAEARRLVHRMQLGADTAMISGRALALSIAPHSYSFVERGDGASGWRATTLPGLAETWVLPASTTLSTDAGAAVLPLNGDDGAQGFSINLANGANHWAINFDGAKARMVVAEPRLPNGAMP